MIKEIIEISEAKASKKGNIKVSKKIKISQASTSGTKNSNKNMTRTKKWLTKNFFIKSKKFLASLLYTVTFQKILTLLMKYKQIGNYNKISIKFMKLCK